jgi:hypothetical protein
LGRGFGEAAEHLGRLGATTSKGADEQSSRRAPGSLVDPGVCFGALSDVKAYWSGRPGPVLAECAKQEDAMRKRMILALIFVASIVVPASAQQAQQGGVRTETQSRLAGQDVSNDLIWNIAGLLGLLGLIGLRGEHPDDSYHPTALD